MRLTLLPLVAVSFCVSSLCFAVSDRDGPAQLSSLPAAAQSSISATLGRDSARYQIHPTSNGFNAANSHGALAIRFTAEGVSVSSGTTRWAMTLRGYGYGDAIKAVRTASPRANLNRVEYRRGALTEWYTNGPVGLEQGFTIVRRPGEARGRPLTIAIALSESLKVEADQSGSELELSDREGKTTLRYSGLVARDASGKEMRSWLESRNGNLLLKVMDAGARYPLTLDPIVQLAELTASDAASGEEFGYSVAASGDTVVVGAPFATVHGVDRQGVVYIFVEPPAGWQNATETAQLTVHDGENQQFGAAVGISGDTVVVGEGNSVNVYIFTKPADGWAPVKPVVKLVGPAAGFGLSVAVSGDTVAVGAPLAGQYNDGVGGAYIYIRPPGGWRLLTTYTCGLGASDSAAGDYFGTSIAVAGNTVVVGAPGSHSTGGAAYVYVEPPGGWPIGMYETGELTVAGASGFASVGTSVAISGNTIVAGAPLINDDLGAAYIFEEPSGGWTSMTQTADLTPDGAVTGSFGDSVAISGSTVIVGSPGATAYHRQEGAAYIFRKPTSGWTDMTGGAKFAPSNGAILDGFGMAVAIADNGAIVVGADQRDENPAAPGKAYIFGP